MKVSSRNFLLVALFFVFLWVACSPAAKRSGTFFFASSSFKNAKDANVCNEALAETTGDCLQLLQPEQNCLRLLQMNRQVKAGLGHQVAEMLMSLRFGSRLGLTPYLYPFEEIESNHHEDYTSVNELFGLHVLSNQALVDHYLKSSQLREVDVRNVIPGECGIVVQADSESCHEVNCFHSPTTSFLFQEWAPCLRLFAAEHGNWNSQDPFSSQNTFHVIWHIRVGDIQLHRPGEEFYTNLYAKLREVLQDFQNVSHTFVGAWERLSQEELELYETYFSTTFPNNARVAHLTTQETLLQMMHCDLLIGSGSSLPLVAALFSGKPVYINSESRKPEHEGWGFLTDYFQEGLTVDYSGKLYQLPSEIRAAFSQKDIASKLKPEARGYIPRNLISGK